MKKFLILLVLSIHVASFAQNHLPTTHPGTVTIGTVPEAGVSDSILTINGNGLVGYILKSEVLDLPIKIQETNISMGDSTNQTLTPSTFNVAIGLGSLQNFIGSNLGPGFENYGGSVGVGWHSLNAVTTGFGNTAIGSAAASALTTGNYNTSVGGSSHNSLTTGSSNVALGFQAGNGITTGSFNVFLGRLSGQIIDTGERNIGIGTSAFRRSSGSRNVVIGDTSLLDNIGDRNTIIGSTNAWALTTGSYNTVIGQQVNVPGSTSNSIYIADGEGNVRLMYNNIGLGNTSLLQYTQDQSSNFNNRSLVDKEYVDTAINSGVESAMATITEKGSNFTTQFFYASAGSYQANGVTDVIPTFLVGNNTFSVSDRADNAIYEGKLYFRYVPAGASTTDVTFSFAGNNHLIEEITVTGGTYQFEIEYTLLFETGPDEYIIVATVKRFNPDLSVTFSYINSINPKYTNTGDIDFDITINKNDALSEVGVFKAELKRVN